MAVQSAVAGNSDLWLLDGSRASRFTFDAATEIRATWSPDGTRVAFASNRTGLFDLYQKLTSGAGVEERVLASNQTKAPSSWSADGRFLLFNNTDPQTSFDIWVVPMVGDRTPWLFLKTPFRELHGEFSPDGRWVAYQSNESERDEVYVRPFVPPKDATRAASIVPATPGGRDDGRADRHGSDALTRRTRGALSRAHRWWRRGSGRWAAIRRRARFVLATDLSAPHSPAHVPAWDIRRRGASCGRGRQHR